MRTISPAPSTTPAQATAAMQRTAWHSPVPYLFGGLAAMLGLIAFALLILACSYWKLSVQSEERERQERDLESGNSHNNDGAGNEEKMMKDQETKVYKEKILVIMAGDRKPTFLATPVTPKFPSLSPSSVSSANLLRTVENDMDGNFDKVKEMGHHENDREDEEEEEEEEEEGDD